MAEQLPAALAAVVEELVVFRRQFESLMLATVDQQGQPHASYAPFVRDPEGNFYVFVSALARHAATLALGRAEVLLIEDEALSSNPFARRRLSFQCRSEVVAPGEAWEQIMTEFSHRFGNIIATLRQLPDFTLYRLVPEHGLYVKGFGQAFRIPGADLARISAIGPDNPASAGS